MSKKNRISTRKAAHAYDIQREQDLSKVQKKKAKKQGAGAGTTTVKSTASTSQPVARPKARKSIKIRKGMKIRGIKVVDSESKKKVLEILKKEQAMKIMEVDEVEDGHDTNEGGEEEDMES